MLDPRLRNFRSWSIPFRQAKSMYVARVEAGENFELGALSIKLDEMNSINANPAENPRVWSSRSPSW